MHNREKYSIGAFWLAIISGVFWAASFPPLPTGFLAYFFLVLMWSALEEMKTGGQAFRLGYIWGFVAAFGTLWWVFKPTLPGMITLVLFMPLYAALYAWMHYRIARKNRGLAVVISPILFVAVEYIRSCPQFGFPWLNIAYSQTGYPVLIQFADIFGSFGISLWIAAINSCVYFILYRPLSKSFWIAVGVLALLFGGAFSYGILRMNQEIEGEPLRIALLQGNVDPYKKWTRELKRRNARLYSDMLHSVEGEADLCIMPETATTCYHRIKPSMFVPIVEAVVEIGAPTLTGSLDFDDEDRKRYFNTALLIMPDGTYDQQYAKIQLVPFSEQVPLGEYFPFLRKIDLGGSHFTSGEDFTIFELDSLRFSVFVCYESVFGWLGRRFRNEGAQFFVNITNDGWFGRTPGPYQHAMFNVVRAIESRCWVARCANTGVSMFIDAHGRVIQETAVFERAVLTGEVIATDKRTIYNAIGDVIGWGALLIAPFLLIFMKFR